MFSGCLRGKMMGESATLPRLAVVDAACALTFGTDVGAPRGAIKDDDCCCCCCCCWDHPSLERCAVKCRRPLGGVNGDVRTAPCTALPEYDDGISGVATNVSPPR